MIDSDYAPTITLQTGVVLATLVGAKCQNLNLLTHCQVPNIGKVVEVVWVHQDV